MGGYYDEQGNWVETGDKAPNPQDPYTWSADDRVNLLLAAGYVWISGSGRGRCGSTRATRTARPWQPRSVRLWR